MTVSPQTTPESQPAPRPTPAPDASRGGRHAVTAADSAEPSIGQLVSNASEAVSTLIHSEIELAKLELRSSVKNAGVGIGLFGAAVVVLVFSLTFGFIALAEGINALGLSRWLSFLIVFVALVAFAVLFVIVGIKKVKRVKAPKQTIETTKETVDYLKKARG